MAKIKIFKLYSNNCYECDRRAELYPATSDWEEIEDSKLYQVREAVKNSNLLMHKKSKYDFVYVLVEQVDSHKSIFATSKEFIEISKKEKEKEEKRLEDQRQKRLLAKKKKEIKTREQKLIQLEKLKKELNES